MSRLRYKPLLIPGYFLLWLVLLSQIHFPAASPFFWLLLIALALWNADFYSGLIHIYLDYRPLDKSKGFDKLFYYPASRDSAEFQQMKHQVLSRSSYLEKVVYNFKIHHRTVRHYQLYTYRDFFYELMPAGAILLGLSGLLLLLPQNLWRDSLAFILLMCSLIAIHTNHIHACVHGSKTMPHGVKVVRWLQKRHLMYSNKTHNSHHKNGISGFCLIWGGADFLVDRICAWLLRRNIISRAEWRGER